MTGRGARAVAVSLASAVLWGCERRTDLAHDVTLDTTPTRVAFTAPVAMRAGPRAFCLEFARPGDSREVSDFEIVLKDSAGAPDTLRGQVDRTGESAACLRDSIPVARTFTEAVVVAPRRLTVRRVYWSTRPP